ncbi:MAG: hypothetical protein GTN62_07560 [Gemmatimonadales bacterium]|nr:hypothetical protein [Gemmatimonadales bacterium]NIN11347.1 hypothetical protein [Gemmatimonadales bacterium]NIN49957.1 hypothetical protein [Gemmatimonadales bacterium]NIP07421.1 hypothetical protein [Gemmatimonadales bacterium]NIR00488.1 hypothetical protein [Gemmatimonadales bacterium]
MTLNIKALAIVGAVFTGGSFLLVGLLNLIFSSYGVGFLELGASLYPGYGGPGGFGSVIVVTLYGLLDGAVAGAIFAWLYNVVAARGGAEKAPRFTA